MSTMLHVNSKTQNPSNSRTRFPCQLNQLVESSPLQGSELALRCPGPLKQAAWGEVKARLSEIKYK